MSRYPPADYRGPRERSRSPPHFSDRRPSAASIFNTVRGGPDAPRGPRSQFDGPRPPPGGNIGLGGSLRPGFPLRNEPIRELRDAPPLGSDRGRPFKDREFDRRERLPSPRDRSPSRAFREPREYPPRDLDIGRGRRGSRDGPLSTGPTNSDAPPFAPVHFRGGGRVRARGDFGFRNGRGGRRELDERDLFRRERSPPAQRWAREHSRDGGQSEIRREARGFDRHDDDRRPERNDRERDMDRIRREAPPPRLEARPFPESMHSGPAPVQPASAPQINPDRLALLESAGADISVRRPSVPQALAAVREPPRREQPEIPAYLNGRAETTNNRYASRGSSPPTQAPPVPAFTLSFTPPAAPSYNGPAFNVWKVKRETKAQRSTELESSAASKQATDNAVVTSTEAAEAAKVPPVAPKAQLADPPLAAPKAPRALEGHHNPATGSSGRLQGVRSWESLTTPHAPVFGSSSTSGTRSGQAPKIKMSPTASRAQITSLTRPVSPNNTQAPRLGQLSAPTGPKVSRASPALCAVSPRPTFASPRSDQGILPPANPSSRVQTPPPSAPSGPRSRSYSVSPKVATSLVPTAPKGNRGPPFAPKCAERGTSIQSRPSERPGALPAWAPPTAPRSAQWNQWRKPGVPSFGEKTIPAKRDFAGEARERPLATSVPPETFESRRAEIEHARAEPDDRQRSADNKMDIDEQPKPAQLPISGHSAKQSFLGKPVETNEEGAAVSDLADDTISSSEDDLEIEDPALFEAKFERQKRQLEAQMVDLSSREYRATTPLESIARLARVSHRDLERFRERELEMDISETHAVMDHHMPPAAHSSESDDGHDVLTPKGEGHAQVTIRSRDDNVDGVRRLRRPSPEVISLPYLLKEPQPPFAEREAWRETAVRHEDTQDAVFATLEANQRLRARVQEDLEIAFAKQYRRWREECEELDREREEQEKLERQLSMEPGPEPDLQMPLPANPIMEGRRLHKFSSEYEIEQVLKQSEETARIEQEKADREARKNQADMEKEAQAPDQITEEELRTAIFVDNNRYRDPDTLTQVFAYEPPVDNFTEEEQKLFIAAFKETPKKWGEIASLLGPHRTYKDCIHHYYANKWDGRFRDNRTRKLKGVRRGRGAKAPPRGKGSALMADLARTEDIVPMLTSESGRPKRAAAPTTFGEREQDAKATLLGPSPAKKVATSSKSEGNGEGGPEKQAKRRRGAGDKPSRKGKAQQPLAALAAAPTMSPNRPFAQGIHTKEDIARAQSLEDASLLAGLQAGHHSMHATDQQIMFAQEPFMMQPMIGMEELERTKQAGPTPSSRSNASSYWSVPEQSDFVKFIAHFGTDFAAIAAHMGTKTHIMIKNHYMRQIDSGNRPDLEEAATNANARRDRGEDMGMPPTPTPIIKRKYEQPQPNMPRALAPHTDAMEIDESAPVQQAAAPKHASPQQFQPQPRFTSSAQSTPIPAQRVAPSPVQAPATVSTPQLPVAAPLRGVPHNIGSRMGLFTDARSESKPGMPSTSSFRATPQRQNQPSQTSRTVSDATDPQFIQHLIEEQKRAQQVQEQYHQQDRMEQQMQHRNSMQQPQTSRSPAMQQLYAAPERKPIEERGPSPPSNSFQSSAPAANLFRPPAFNSLAATLVPMFAGRPSTNGSPPKTEESRPSSVPLMPPSQSSTASAPPAEAPKRSNLMSILNSEAEDPKPAPKRISSDQSMLQGRTVSPASRPFLDPASGTTRPGMAQSRHETFGQPSILQPHFRHPSLSQSQLPPSGPPTLKQENSSSGTASLQQAPKHDWTAGLFPQRTQASQTNDAPALEREVRPYGSHQASVFGGLNNPSRVKSSPPPHTGNLHSRTPSLTAQGSSQPPREPRTFLPGHQQQQQQAPPQSGQPLQPAPYAPESLSTFFGQHGPGQAQNHARHSHNTSVTSGFPSIHHERAFARDELARQQEQATHFAQQRQREDHELRRIHEARALDAQRERGFIARREEEDRQRQQQQQHPFVRRPGPPPPPVPPSHFGSSPFEQRPGAMLGLREQSMREAHAATMREEQRVREMEERRRYDEEMRRRHDDAMFPTKRTPLGGGFGLPPSRR